MRSRSAAALLALVALAGASGAGACMRPPGPPADEAASRAAGANSRVPAGACRRAPPACPANPPTYPDDVRPILARRCFKCHAGDGVAAEEHDFSRVETLRAQRVALTSELRACAMPPSSEPPLADAEAEVVLRWAACETPRPNAPGGDRASPHG